MREGAAEQEHLWSGWMAAAQAGDAAAYDRLLRAIVPFLRVLVRRRLRQAEAAEDAVQEVLLTLHRVRHTYDPARPFTPWLAAIAARRSIDGLRRQGRIQRHEAADDEAAVTFADPASNKELREDDAAAELALLLAELPAGQRQALELLKVQELSLREAAAVSGQSEGALKVAVHRGIKALKARLSGRDT